MKLRTYRIIKWSSIFGGALIYGTIVTALDMFFGILLGFIPTVILFTVCYLPYWYIRKNKHNMLSAEELEKIKKKKEEKIKRINANDKGIKMENADENFDDLFKK